MTPEQRRALQHELSLVGELLKLPFVKKHETRFANEVALVAPALEVAAVAAVVERYVPEAAKHAGASPSAELAASKTVAAMGGVRSDQTLYLKPVDSQISFYVAFWPWGGGKQFTIKIGIHVGA